MADKLPFELLIDIMDHLDPSSYVEANLEVSPARAFSTKSEHLTGKKDLKNASLACRFWNHAARPFLFRHLSLRVHHWPHDEDPIPKPLNSFSKWAEKNHDFLATVVQGVTIFLMASPQGDSVRRLMINKLEELAFDADLNARRLSKLITEYNEDLAFARSPRCKHCVVLRGHHDPLEMLWRTIYRLVPARLTFIGTGTILAYALSASHVYNPYEIHHRKSRIRLINFSRAWKPLVAPKKLAFRCMKPFLKILSMADWTDITVNEGSRFTEEEFPEEEMSLVEFLEEFGGSFCGLEDGNSMTYVAEFGFFKDARSFAAIAYIWSPQWKWKRFCFKMLPQGFDLNDIRASAERAGLDFHAVKSHCETEFSVSQHNVDVWQRWFRIIQAPHNYPMFHHYEFPDLVREDKLWKMINPPSEQA